MGNQHNHRAVYLADRPPPMFAILDTILFGHGQRVAEHPKGQLETDSMFAQVAGRLGFVPVEPYSRRTVQSCLFVTTNL
jgi:hypothetical protein